VSSKPAHVDFYFDYVSGYSYFAWWNTKTACAARGVELRPRPVLFAGLLDHWGHLGPAEIPPKATYIFRDWLRTARLTDVPYSGPKTHPFNPLLALRLSLREVGRRDQTRIVDVLFRAGWAQGVDLSDDEALERVLDDAGLDGLGLLAQARDPVVKQALREETDAAIARGVFGVPSMIAGGELFFGNDRVEHLALRLDGRDPLDDDDARAALARARPRGAERRR
jgi:2-hydroxychromene-2-carboxylate isomerase